MMLIESTAYCVFTIGESVGMGSTKRMEQALSRISAKVQERAVLAKTQEVDVSDITEIETTEASHQDLAAVSKSNIGRKIIESANLNLAKGEQLGLFESYPVADKNAIPTLLARLPIFIPVPASKQPALLDKDLAYPFETPFGKGRRFGPPVTIDDEDVLFALLQLSERRLIGQGGKLPVPLNDNDSWLKDGDGKLTVQVTLATISQINQELGLTKAGNNYKSTLASIKRLNHVSIELETRCKDMYFGESWAGEKIRLVDIKWRTFEEQGFILAQFSPIIVKWLKEQCTFFNWKIRRQIKSANGRALHRFLSTQGKHYKAKLEYIADVIEWDGNRSRIRPRMEAILTQLRDDHGWCDFEITGTGRTAPFELEFWRKRT